MTEVFHTILVETQEAAEQELNLEDTKCLNGYFGESPVNSPRSQSPITSPRSQSPITSPRGESKALSRAGVLKQQIKFISKILVMQKLLREQNEVILQIKSHNNNKLPRGLLAEGKEAMEVFLKAAEEDSVNERIPY